MSDPVEKHLPYYGLLESLLGCRGCALCDMRERTTCRYLDSLLHEYVNDASLRNRLLQSRGFCIRHADILLSFGDGLGISILYQDQMKVALEFLQRLRKMRAKVLRKKALGEWENHDHCPVCVLEERNDEFRIGTLLAVLHDSRIRQALEQSPGLCIPHLLKALVAENEPSIHQYLIDLHCCKFALLMNELREFCRKHDFRYSHEEYGKEADSWRRAVEMLLGRR
jgi:hypothetical protein